jgi:enoyl-CoA hydratase/carnithine racemase
MAEAPKLELVGVTVNGMVAEVELRQPPNNFISNDLVGDIGDALDWLDTQDGVRAVVLCAAGKHFCAGADFSRRAADGAAIPGTRGKHLYKYAQRLWRTRKPIVCAVHGAAIGAGMGLALVGDFRVTCDEARWSANFTRMNYHPGFGLTATLPRLIGPAKASLLFYTGRRLTGTEAYDMGLAELLVPLAEVRSAAAALALEIAQSGPAAVQATRETLRRGLADAVAAATEREFEEQDWLRQTEDFREGIKAMAERRLPDFKNR